MVEGVLDFLSKGRVMVDRFIQQLFGEGRIRLQHSDPATDEDLHQAARWVMESEFGLREHLPFTPPEVNPASVEWSVAMFYGAAQLAVFRHLGEDEIKERLRRPSPAVTASNIYSVDLVFRFLPDLLRIVKGMNPGDPLVSVLKDWCQQWPLSSVGAADCGKVHVDVILGNRCLSAMYSDRIIAAYDKSRLGDPRVAELVRGALGAYPELHPKLHKLLTEPDPPSPEAHAE